MTQIAFIGLGHMGAPMAQNLGKAGHQVKVYDINPDAIHATSGEGMTPATTIQDAVQGATIIFTMLQTGDQVSECCVEDNGIFDSMSKTAVFIDCSTIGITDCCLLHKKADEFGVQMLDAPVSGGVKAAQAASLTFIVAGQPATFKQVEPVLSSMGKQVLYVGDAANGIAAKLCNNMVLGVTMIAVSEAFHLAQKIGLDAKTLHHVMINASANCWVLEQYCPVPGVLPNMPADNHYQPGFTASMMLKDLILSQYAAEEVGANTQLGDSAQRIYNQFVAQGKNAKLDFSAIIQMLEGQQ